MSTLSRSPVPPPESSGLISVAEYHAMIDAGVIGEDDPVELLEGVLVFKMSKSKPHIGTNIRMNRWLVRSLPPEWVVQNQDPITLSDSEPEPDFSCVTLASLERVKDKATASETALAVEISDSSLAGDRSRKLRIYARAGIVEYWIVNLVDRQIEVFTQPTGDGYASRVVHRLGDTISLSPTLGGATIAVASLLQPT